MSKALLAPYLSQQPVTDFGLEFSDLKYAAILAADTDSTLIIPGNAQRYKALIITPPGTFVFVALNQLAELPSPGPTLGRTTSEMVQTVSTCREVRAGDVLHFISATNGIPVSVVLYALNTTS